MSNVDSNSVITVVDDLIAATPIPEEGLGHYTVLTHPDLRVVVLAFSDGHLLKEHAAPFPVLMQALTGELLVRAGGEETQLIPGNLLRLDAMLRHEVQAVSASRLLLTLITR
ncbi:MAG: cupin domain-containing protein [Cryobacterium sp.]|nr:cupin domain-containing protein [Cryobacterium sp.]